MDNTYTWTAVVGEATPNGTAFTDFLPKLNAESFDGVTLTGCFAGHCDWRLPTIVELQTIRLEPYPCHTSPCVTPILGPTVGAYYWSSTPAGHSPNFAYLVDFTDGYRDTHSKGFFYYVRAVRAGL